MRKQYHSRASARGKLVWVVDRLVSLAKPLLQKRVPLSSLRELEEFYWFGGAQLPTCPAIADHARLIEATNSKYPIILSSAGRVMHGMHRVAKAYILGHESSGAVQKVGVIAEISTTFYAICSSLTL